MRKRSITGVVLFVLLGIFVFCSCQQAEKKVTEDNDKTKNKMFLDSLITLCQINPDSARIALQHNLSSSKIQEDSNLYFMLFKYYGGLLYNIGEVDSSKYFLNKAKDYWKNQKDSAGQYTYGVTLNNLAYITNNEGNFDVSTNYHDKALCVSKKNKFSDLLISTLLSKVNMLSKRENYGEAIECVEEAIKVCDELQDSSRMISCLQAYADVYVNCNFFEEAQIQFQEVQKYKSSFTPRSLFTHHNSKGRMFYLKGEYIEARDEFINANKQWEYLDLFDKLIVSNNLAEIFLFCEQADSAKVYLDYLTEQLPVYKGFSDFEMNYYSLMGEYFKKKNKDKEASRAFQKADEIRNKNGVDNVLNKLHTQRRALFLFEIGDYRKAFIELQRYNQLNRNILEENNRKQVSTLKYRYQRDTSLVRQQETILNQEMTVKHLAARQNYMLIIGGLVFVFIAGVILWWRNSECKKQEIQSLTHARDVAVLRMENARNRISPHFMFNVLNAVMRDKDSNSNMEQNLKAFTHLLQANLSNVDSIGIPLSQELKFVKDFVMLDNLRFQSDIEYKEEIGLEVNVDMLIPSMCIHILVENAIKHGLRPKQGKKELCIKVEKGKGEKIISVIDNGVGRGFYQKQHGTGTGMKVLKQFISIVNQNNLAKIRFEIVDLKDAKGASSGTVSILKIPQNINYKI